MPLMEPRLPYNLASSSKAFVTIGMADQEVNLYNTSSVNAVASQTYCATAVVPQTDVTDSTGIAYTWINSNTAIGLAASGTGNIPSFMATNTGSLPITATITVTPTASGCTRPTTSYAITVNPVPILTMLVDHQGGVSG